MEPFDLLGEIEKEAQQRGRRVEPGQAESRFDGAEERKDPGILRTIESAFENENTISSIGRAFDRNRAANTGPRIDPDQVIRSNPEYQQRLDNLPEEYRDTVREARTEAELEFILRAGEERLRNAEQLEAGGLGQSLASYVAVGLVDPVDWAVTAATGGTGKLVRTGNALRRVAVGGGSAGTANLAVETLIDDPTRDGTDQVAAFALGFGLGGILNARGRPVKDTPAQRQLADSIGRGVEKAVERPARQTTGFDMGRYMSRSRSAESSGNDAAKAATSSAYGRYQFLQDTWVAFYRATFGETGETRAQILAKRADGKTQDRVMETFTRSNIRELQRAGVPVNDASVYLAHFLGPRDAIKVLRATAGTDIRGLVRAASIKANATVFAKVRTAGDLLAWASRKMNSAVAYGTGPINLGPGALGEVPTLNPANVPSFQSLYRQGLNEAEDRVDLGGQLFDLNPGAVSGGAAAKQVEDVEYFGTQFLLPGTYGKMLDRSVPVKMRGLASELIAGTSRVDDQTRAIAAEEIASSLERSWRSRLYLSFNPHFNAWRKEQGIGLIRGDLTSGPQQDFMRQVTRAMLGDTSVSPHARKAADAFSDSYAEVLRRAKDARIEGFDDVKFDRGYVPRRVNAKKFMSVRAEVGAEGVRAILRQAMIAREMDPALAERVARAYEEGTVDRITYRKTDSFTGPSEDSIERLRYYLPDDDPELVDDVISYLKQFRKEGNPDAGRISEARFRIDMDLLRPVTINGKTYTALDLFEDDASMLFERYSRTMGGWVALAERSGIRSEADWQVRLKDAVAGNEGDPNTATRIQRLNEIKDLILGRSISNEDATIARAGQALMKLNFATSMGQAGMASIAELGNIIGNMGLRNAMAHMPVLRTIFAGARSGTLDDAFTDEVRAIFGVGMRTKLTRGRAGYDEFADEMTGKLADTVDRILDPLARGVGYAGLIGPVNDYLQTLAAKSFVQKLASVATGKAKFTEADILRLRDGGFEDGVLDRVLTSIRQNGTFDGKRLVSLNPEKWDRDLLAQLQYTTDRMVYRAVQENDIGSSAWWQHTMLGRMMTQFRSFILNAYVKQTLHALRFRDAQAFTALALTTTFGGMAWLARTYINTATDPEQREKMLTPERLATAALSATGYASILPTVVDTGLVQAGSDPLFAHVRTTGLSTSLIQGMPVVSTADALMSSATLPARLPRDDYEFSQDDARKLTRLLPFNNVTGIRNLIDLMEEDLPRRSQEDDYRQ